MSTVKTNNVQIGQSLTASQNFTWYQPSTPDGTVRLGNGNSGSVTDLVTLTSAGALTLSGALSVTGNTTIGDAAGDTLTINAATVTLNNSTTISAASTKTLTLNGGAGSNGLVLDASNRVGIGNGSPTALFNLGTANSQNSLFKIIIGSGASNEGLVIVPSLTGKGWIGFNNANNSSIPGQLTYDFSSSTMNLFSSGSTTFTVNATGTAATLDSSGNLGLGVTPSAWAGGVKAFDTPIGSVYSTTGNNMLLVNNFYFNGSSLIYRRSDYASGYEQISGKHTWYIAPSGTAGNAVSLTQAMTLDASGNLLVAKTTSNDTSQVGFLFNNVGAMTATLDSATSGTTYGLYNKNATNNGYRFYVNVDGGIRNYSANNVNLASDLRLKNTIEPVKSYWDIFKEIDWVTWLYNDQAGNRKNIGVIAQDLQLLAPELVCESGKEAPDGEPPYLGLYDQDFKMAAMSVITQLVNKMDELHAEIELLKAKVN